MSPPGTSARPTLRPCAVGADHQPRRQRAGLAGRLVAVDARASPSASRSIRWKVPVSRSAPAPPPRGRAGIRRRCSRSTMPTKPSSIGMSTRRAVGETIRAVLIRATIWLSGMAKSAISRGGIAPPQGLIRPARSSSATRRPARARSSAAVAPDGPPPPRRRHRSSRSFSRNQVGAARGRCRPR